MGMRILNEALRKMVNAEKRGFTKVQLQPMSLLMVNYLNVMKSRGYIKDFEVFEPHRVGRITVELEGRIKDCKALSYRQDIRAKDIESYKSRILPTRQDLTNNKGKRCPNPSTRLPQTHLLVGGDMW
uniref:30S ribosomal protein S8, chloroplastic n=1 Tax=Picea sitchensis TaxID=3332 RepID=A9NQX2_PICSI|nr:unknown [Picea sitchensis]